MRPRNSEKYGMNISEIKHQLYSWLWNSKRWDGDKGHRKKDQDEFWIIRNYSNYLKYPKAEVIKLIVYNVNVHKDKSFYEAFDEDEANYIQENIEFHYMAKNEI